MFSPLSFIHMSLLTSACSHDRSVGARDVEWARRGEQPTQGEFGAGEHEPQEHQERCGGERGGPAATLIVTRSALAPGTMLVGRALLLRWVCRISAECMRGRAMMD
jgi:hypothetical protein